MPKPLQYKSGSLIYAQGEKADKIFVLHSGKVSLVYQDIKTGDDIREYVQAGEFFGIKSTLGHYPREENVIAAADSVVLALTVSEFESLALSNTKIIMQLLKVFSHQMRNIHDQIASLLETDTVNPEEALFDLGLKFMARKRFAYAQYVFKRCLELYPESKDAERVQKNLYLAEISILCSEDENQEKTNETSDGAPAPDIGTFSRFAKEYKSGEIFFCENEPGENCYLIQSGKVRLVKNTGDVERTLDILQPPDMFGEMALLENSPRTATAIAVDSVTALEFNLHNFETLLSGNPQLALRLLKIFSKRIYDSKRRFTVLKMPDLPAKVAYVFMMLDETQTDIDRTGNSREFHTTVEDVAQWAGLSLSKARETLNNFASQNRLEIFSNRIIIKNINDFIRLVNSRLNQM